MTDQLKQAAMQQALNLIERLNAHGWILADFEEEVYASIASLKAVLKQQPEQEPPQYSLKAHWTDDKRIGVVVCVTRPDGGVHLIQTIIDPPPPVQEPLEQLRPAEFIQLTKGKEAVTGIPAYCWSEWLNKEQP